MSANNLPDIKDLVNLMANQDTRLMSLERSMGHSKENIFSSCIGVFVKVEFYLQASAD